MRLPDGPRQILAAVLAGGAFLALFFLAQLVWWLAFALAAAVYLALLLMVRRQRPAEEIMLAARVSAADIHRAAAGMDAAAARLANAAKEAPEADATLIEGMAARVRSIRNHVANDPEDYRRTRRFITSYLPNMVDSVERYARLAGQARGSHVERLAALRESIRGYGPTLERIDRACLENDFDALEVEVDVLTAQMKRG